MTSARGEPSDSVQRSAGKLLAIAHRAGNSLAALRAAVEAGVDVIEADVHHHRGALEVRHHKTMGPLPLLWDTWELMPASRPRLGLTELVRAAAAGATFMLDLKGRGTDVGVEVASLLHVEAPERPVIVCSREWPVLDAFAGVDWIRVVRSARKPAELAALRAHVPRSGGYGVSVHQSLLSADLVAELREHVEVVMTWPVNDLRTLDRVVSAGATGIISDEPAILREVHARA
ncbi:MAG TPA: glycerophosphodiester phosphodiesterase [Mycobacteriales bacterium]|nr:glycerophosphodiester phosphodiesterase [Mycobacteriales bacterium]